MKIHISIGDYEFIEADVENVEDARMLRDDIKHEFSKGDGEGLKNSDWCKVMNEYLKTGRMSSDDYALLSKPQRYVIQEVKKTLKRLGAVEE